MRTLCVWLCGIAFSCLCVLWGMPYDGWMGEPPPPDSETKSWVEAYIVREFNPFLVVLGPAVILGACFFATRPKRSPRNG